MPDFRIEDARKIDAARANERDRLLSGDDGKRRPVTDACFSLFNDTIRELEDTDIRAVTGGWTNHLADLAAETRWKKANLMKRKMTELENAELDLIAAHGRMFNLRAECLALADDLDQKCSQRYRKSA